MTFRWRWADLRLRTKLTLLIEAAMLLLGLSTSALATMRMRAMLETQLTRRGLAIAGDLAIFAVRPLLAEDLATLRRFVNHSMSQDYVRSVAILGPDGTVVMHSDLAQLRRRIESPAAARAVAATDAGVVEDARAPGTYAIHYPIRAAGARLGTVLLGYSREAAETEIEQARRQILWVWLLAAVLSGGMAYLLASYIAGPIGRIAAAMAGAPERLDAARVVVSNRDEIGTLATSFNRMAEELEQHRQHLSRLVDDRTSALRETNARLHLEIAQRTRVEDELRTSREELRALTAHLQSVREQERTEIAREIHDELGQSLTALKFDTRWIGQHVTEAPADLRRRLEAMAGMIDGTVQTVRRISSELRPQLLDDLGLSAAIEWQARQFEARTGTACRVTSEPDDVVAGRGSATALFRIFQEALTNVARHANASRVDVSLHQRPEAIEMTVADNGVGLAPAPVCDRRALGIVGMRERALALGGDFEIAGRPEGGTCVRVVVPAGEERS